MADYVAGKADWMASGMPVEGEAADTTTLQQVARTDVPRFALSDTVADVVARIEGWPAAVVVNDSGVVLGLVRAEVTGLDAQRSVASVMQEGPSTYRADVEPAEASRNMSEQGLPRAPVTRPDGTLIGMVELDDLPPVADPDG